METVMANPAASTTSLAAGTRFVNAMRLSAACWVAAGLMVAAAVAIVPRFWKRVERFDTDTAARIPYELSNDYWLYEWKLQRTARSDIVLIGDSVIWGEYVRPEGTLSHFLNEQARQRAAFVNAGVNGMFPLALEGLLRHHGRPLHHRKILLHCNVLWLSSPKADMQTEKEERFNHATLVPQFVPRIPCYKADLNQRLAAVVERNFAFSQWANHLQIVYFGQKNMLAWTLEEDGNDPALLPNAYKNPFARITLAIPTEPAEDPQRGPNSPRHKPWSQSGQGTTRFQWVELERSLQWNAFQRLIQLLQSRDNDLFVVLGPFNEHIMTEENRVAFRQLRDGVAAWLSQRQVPHIIPTTLPSVLYADASHPLTEGYARLARDLLNDPPFLEWTARSELP
jgi:hypothetical protein